MRGDISAICGVLREYDRFLVSCHENPEGDAIGSELALALALRKMGKTVTILNADPVPRNLLFLSGTDTVVFAEDGSKYDVAVLVDCNSVGRTGKIAGELLKPRVRVIIDHHQTSEDLGPLALIDSDAAAAGLLVYKVLVALGVEIDRDIAKNVYTAILTDTGSFRYGNSSQEAFCVAGEMIRLGVNPWAVSEQVYETQSYNRLRLLGRVLSSLETVLGGRVAAITTLRADLDEFEANKDDLEGFINYPRSILGTEVAVSFREEGGGEVRISFRSKGRIDVSGVAARFGGGGHRNAAGCTVSGALEEVKRQIFEAIETVLS
ncbi:MAG: bifunctional oligoribonuclease/PAP phosphatase NrnA [Syntrophorhabdaceae bacterium]|nr:bifunctional oligoribonuclease/PAP phosphatase NrnA [Syntrophorhabdaceae bacterium]